MHSTHAREFTLKLLDSSEIGKESIPSKTYEEFNDVIKLSDSVNIKNSTKSVLIFIAGYVAFKVKNKIDCKECASLLFSNEMLEYEFESEEVEKYMLLIDREALNVQSNLH